MGEIATLQSVTYYQLDRSHETFQLGLYLQLESMGNLDGEFCSMARALAKRNLKRKHVALARDAILFPSIVGVGVATATIPPGQNIFVQGEPCDALYYLHAGTAKIHVLSKSGQEAVLLILGPGDFFGDGAMLENARRAATVTTMTECTVERIDVSETWRRLRNGPAFAKAFMDFLVTRNRRYLAAVSDYHFHSTEQRLARTLFRLAKADLNGELTVTLPRLSQETLADMVGTTRTRVNFFMNKFRRHGMIEYSGKFGGKFVVRRSLSAVFSRD